MLAFLIHWVIVIWTKSCSLLTKQNKVIKPYLNKQRTIIITLSQTLAWESEEPEAWKQPCCFCERTRKIFFFTPLIEFISKDETLCMDKGVVFSLVFQKVTQVDRRQHTAIGGALPEHCIKLGSAQELTTKQLDFTVVQTTVCWSVAFLLYTRINTKAIRCSKVRE